RSGDSSKKFKIAEGQWYRYAPSYVSPAYHLLEGFPFIQEPPSGDLQERVLIRHHDYDQCFQSVQLLQWKDRKSGSAGMPRPISYAVFCLKKKPYVTGMLQRRRRFDRGGPVAGEYTNW